MHEGEDGAGRRDGGRGQAGGCVWWVLRRYLVDAGIEVKYADIVEDAIEDI